MKKLSIMLLCLAFVFTGCSEQKEGINVYNWGDYIDEEILEDFENEYGIHVNYETYGSNEDLYVKIKNTGEAYDVVFPSEYMASKMIAEGLLYKFDTEALSNFKNLDDGFKNMDYDKNNEYTVPYFWGTMGLVYNKDLVDEADMTSFDCLFDDKYKGEVFLFEAQRDVLAVGLKILGYSLNTKSIDELNEARDLMTEQKKVLRAYLNDNMKTMMLLEEGAIGYTDSGAAAAIVDEGGDDKFGYSIPKEGSNMWVDVMAIPANAKHKEEAKLFIDYLMREDVAQKNLDYVQYSSPIKTVEIPDGVDEEIWEKFQASPEEQARCEVYTDLGDFTKEYSDAWMYIKAHD